MLVDTDVLIWHLRGYAQATRRLDELDALTQSSLAAFLLYPAAAQPAGLKTRCVEAGFPASFAAGRLGRATSSPPHFGHTDHSNPSAHASQNVAGNLAAEGGPG